MNGIKYPVKSQSFEKLNANINISVFELDD